MIDPRFEELAALAAIGAASDEERAELARMVSADPAVASEVGAWEGTAHALGEALEPQAPPAGGLERLRAAIAAQGAQRVQEPPPPFSRVANPEYAQDKPLSTEGAEITSLASRRQRRVLASGLGVALAAAAAFLFLWMDERNRTAAAISAAEEAVRKDAQAEIEKLSDQLSTSESQAAVLSARLQPLRVAGLELATLKADGGGFAYVLAGKDSDGVARWSVFANSLPPIGSDKDYQLWFVPPTGKPVSAGLLSADPDGLRTATPSVPQELTGTKLRPAISLEPSGGSEQPTEVKLIGEPI